MKKKIGLTVNYGMKYSGKISIIGIGIRLKKFLLFMDITAMNLLMLQLKQHS